jgi:hypothetical protein
LISASFQENDSIESPVSLPIIHYKNNLIDKKDSYPISCLPSWDDRNYSYCHQLYPSEYIYFKNILSVPSGGETGLSMLSFS